MTKEDSFLKNSYSATSLSFRSSPCATNDTGVQTTIAIRAGIEGTISQGVRSLGLRQCRYIGLSKAHFQHLATAAAMNLVRVIAWLEGIPLARTRQSHFVKLAPATG